LNAATLRLLVKALAVSPDDWETRAHLIEHHLASLESAQALALVRGAPNPPAEEGLQLLCARALAQSEPGEAIERLQSILAANKACARAYLELARIYRGQGLRDEARRKYGAATLLDETLEDAEFSAWLGDTPAGGGPAALQASDGAGEGVTPEEIAAALKDVASPDSPGRPRITFDQVGGMTDVIERIRMNIIYPFKNPQLFSKFNRSSGGGILLYGPPGCGKTHIARATAGECDAAFIPIAITDVLSKWLGESERHLHEIFESARRRSPAVVFIDEIDAIGVSRSEASGSMAPIVNVLLTELDGVGSDNTNVMVLAATNSPWRVDSALRRPGRFDRVVFVPPPDAGARDAILKIHLREVPCEAIDSEKIARAAEKFSGADLKALVSRASEKAIMAEMRTGTAACITQRMLLETLKEMRPSTVEWLETARNYASYANRSGLYDDLVRYFESH
jgi:SpoVK/Ycf46/Vps4 family AAA+-type ATPase